MAGIADIEGIELGNGFSIDFAVYTASPHISILIDSKHLDLTFRIDAKEARALAAQLIAAADHAEGKA